MTRTSSLEVSIKTYIDCILYILIAPSVLLLYTWLILKKMMNDENDKCIDCASIPTEDHNGFSHTVCVVLLSGFVVFCAASGLKYTTNTGTTRSV